MDIIFEANLLIWKFHTMKIYLRVKDFGRTFVWVNNPAIYSILRELPICTTKQQSLQHCQWKEKLLLCFIKKRKLLYLWLNKLEKICPASIFYCVNKTFIENTTFTVKQWLAETFSQDRYLLFRRHCMDRNVAAFSRNWGLVFWKASRWGHCNSVTGKMVILWNCYLRLFF